jgi:excisionase family DNA binding protein
MKTIFRRIIMTKENDNYLTIKEVAEKTNLSTVKLYTILHYDRLGYETIGKRIVIPKKTFEEWQKTNIKLADKEEKKKK